VEYIVTALAVAGDSGESRLLAGAGSYEVTIVDRIALALNGLTLVKHLREAAQSDHGSLPHQSRQP